MSLFGRGRRFIAAPIDRPTTEPDAPPADEMVSVKLPRHLVELWQWDARRTMPSLAEACAAALTEDDR